MNEFSTYLNTFEYDQNFWNAMCLQRYDSAILEKGLSDGHGTYKLPTSDNAKFLSYLKSESLFRRIATVITLSKGDHTIFAKDCDDLAEWYAEGETIPIYEGIQDFTTHGIGSHKLVNFVKFDENFVRDASFNFKEYLLRRFARVAGRAEEKAFITGTTAKQPNGLLKADIGAEVGVSVAALTYDSVVDLFFSLKPEYRYHGIWIMNDETALFLRKLKDGDGNYIWNHANDTILGKPVMISNFMPSAGEGNIPILFGDYSYYWIICRRPFSLHALYEKFAIFDQVGYVGVEYLDSRLLRREAVKALQITS